MTRGRVALLLPLLLLLVVAVAASMVVGMGLKLVAPSPAVLGDPPQVLAGAQDVAFASSSGSVLRGWFLPASRPGGGGVVLAHGYRTTRGMFVRRAAILHQAGFGVLMFDFQAEGESPGAHVTLGHLEGLDVAAAVAEMHRRLPGERIGALGVSLGGAAILLAPQPLAIDAAVLESTFPTIDSALRNRLALSLPRLAAPVLTAMLAPLLEAMMRPVLGLGPADLRPIDRIAGLGAPVFVLSGEADRHTTIAEARGLFDRAAEPKAFWAVPGAGHVDLERAGPDAYWAHVMPFLQQRLQTAT